MRATEVGREGWTGRATAWTLSVLSVGAVALTVLLVWELLVDPVSLAQVLEAVVGGR